MTAREELPEWLQPIHDALADISVHDLTRFMPPAEQDVRRGAVLMLFGEGPAGPDLLLTERNREMRSHPGQVSFPGGMIDPGETAHQAAVREAEEETGLDGSGVAIFGELPELFLPPSNYAVVPVVAWWREESAVRVTSPEEVHAVYRIPLSELTDPEHQVAVSHPSGWVGPGFMIGDDKDVILWGFTGGIVSRLFEYVGWITEPESPRVVELPDYMFVGQPTRSDFQPNTEFEERRR